MLSLIFLAYLTISSSLLSPQRCSSRGEIWETTGRLRAMPPAADRYVYGILYCERVVMNQSGCFITRAKSLKAAVLRHRWR